MTNYGWSVLGLFCVLAATLCPLPADAIVPVEERIEVGAPTGDDPPLFTGDMPAAMATLRFAIRNPTDQAAAVAAATEIIRINQASSRQAQELFPLVSDVRLEAIEKRLDAIDRILEPPAPPDPPQYRPGDEVHLRSFLLPPGTPYEEHQ